MLPFTYRDAVKLIRQHGGTLWRHGANHDLFELPGGALIAVPRHRKDFSRGVEASIKGAVRCSAHHEGKKGHDESLSV